MQPRPENLIASPGEKFVIIFTLPSGAKLALGGHEGKVALIPVVENERVKQVLSWNSTDDLFAWVDQFQKINGEETWGKFAELNPTITRILVAH